MDKRVTLISMLDTETMNRISKLVKHMDICKVPYGILKDKEIVERRFKPFEIALDKLGLFEIYPAKLEEEIVF